MDQLPLFTNARSAFDSLVISGTTQSELDMKQWIASTRQVHPGHALEASMDDRMVALRSIIDGYIEDNYHLCIGLSGKDSLCLLANVVNILLARKRQSLPDTRLDVFTSNTKIDSVLMTNVIADLASQLMAFTTRHELSVHYHLAQPALSADYLVGILGGRTIPTTAANRSRKCAVDLKVNVIKRVQKAIVKANAQQGKHTLMLLGKYYTESTERERRMIDNQESFIPKTINDQMVASPLCMWSMYDVFEFMHRATSYDDEATLSSAATTETMSPIAVFGDFTAIKQAYNDMSGGCTFSIINEGKAASKPCDARSGCHQCLAIGKDRSAQNLIEQYPYIAPLYHIRNYLAAHHNNPAQRAWITRKLKRVSPEEYQVKLSPDTYNIDHCLRLLQFYATAHFDEIDRAESLDIAPRFTVLSLDQVLAIGLFQERYGMASGWEALSVYEHVANTPGYRVLPDETDDITDFDSPLQPRAILQQHGMTSATITLNSRLAQQLETPYMGTRDVLETFTETEVLHISETDSDAEPVRAVDVSETGEFHIDLTTESWAVEQELLHHIDAYRQAVRDNKQHPRLFHVLTRLGILTFNNRGAAQRWDAMHRVGAVTSIIHSLNASNPQHVATILSK